jgi:hypothetical protein
VSLDYVGIGASAAIACLRCCILPLRTAVGGFPEAVTLFRAKTTVAISKGSATMVNGWSYNDAPLHPFSILKLEGRVVPS